MGLFIANFFVGIRVVFQKVFGRVLDGRRRQKTEDRRQKTEVRSRRSEVGRWEIGDQELEDLRRLMELFVSPFGETQRGLTEDRRLETEDGRHELELFFSPFGGDTEGVDRRLETGIELEFS